MPPRPMQKRSELGARHRSVRTEPVIGRRVAATGDIGSSQPGDVVGEEMAAGTSENREGGTTGSAAAGTAGRRRQRTTKTATLERFIDRSLMR